MIELSLTEAMLWFAVLGLGSIILIWSVDRVWSWIVRLRQRRRRIRCRLCHFRYIDEEKTPLSNCPSCGGLNQRGGQRRL